jgi:hypothetical protein
MIARAVPADAIGEMLLRLFKPDRNSFIPTPPGISRLVSGIPKSLDCGITVKPALVGFHNP